MENGIKTNGVESHNGHNGHNGTQPSRVDSPLNVQARRPEEKNEVSILVLYSGGTIGMKVNNNNGEQSNAVRILYQNTGCISF